MEVVLVRERVRGQDRAPFADITTADAATQGPTVLVHILVLTAVAHHHSGIRPRHSSPTLNPSPVTTVIATPSPAVVTATAEVEAPVIKGSARALGRGPAVQSK